MEWYFHPSDSLCHDGEQGQRGREDEDDEEGGYSGAQFAIVVVARGAEVANDISWVGPGQIDIGRV